MNLIAQNSIYEKIYIYTNNLDDKYSWLKNKFKDDAFIYINEINSNKIDKEYINLIIFDDLIFSNKKISEFYCRSRKLQKFQNINTNLKRYEFILIDKYNQYKFIRIRKNLDQILCK